MKTNSGLILLIFMFLSGCSTLPSSEGSISKVEFDLDRLDTDGLLTLPEGKRALSYEFCIPANVEAAQSVMEVDPSAIVYNDSPGGIGCTQEQYRVMGDTFQKDYKVTLQSLSRLNYVTHIVEVHFK